MSFNIRGASYADGANVWEKRADLNIQVIKTADPDVIGFQEYQEGNHISYLDQLKAYTLRKGEVYNRPGRQFYNTIAWKSELFNLVESQSGTIYLSNTPAVYSKDWGAARVHVFHWVTLEERQTGKRFTFGTTHLDHESEAARLKSAHLMVETVQTLDLPQGVILTGDFNSPADLIPSPSREETVYSIFKAGQFIDTFENDRSPLGAHTVHGFQTERFHSRKYSVDLRLDWILTTPQIKSSHFEIIRSAEPPIFPSDHYPIIADLEL